MENSMQSLPSLSLNAHLTRQLDLIPMAALDIPVHIIGCGAIGSFAALTLAKMGITRITAYDFDSVSIENMSNQFFRHKDIGTNKAQALRALIEDFTNERINAHVSAFTPDHAPRLNGIVIPAVDSMEARKMIWTAIQASGFNVKLVIDPRMSAEYFSQYAINPFDEKDKATYEKTLYSDSEAIAERCTAKSTSYTATLAAGVVTKTIKNYILGESFPRLTHWNIKSSTDPMAMWGSKE